MPSELFTAAAVTLPPPTPPPPGPPSSSSQTRGDFGDLQRQNIIRDASSDHQYDIPPPSSLYDNASPSSASPHTPPQSLQYFHPHSVSASPHSPTHRQPQYFMYRPSSSQTPMGNVPRGISRRSTSNPGASLRRSHSNNLDARSEIEYLAHLRNESQRLRQMEYAVHQKKVHIENQLARFYQNAQASGSSFPVRNINDIAEATNVSALNPPGPGINIDLTNLSSWSDWSHSRSHSVPHQRNGHPVSARKLYAQRTHDYGLKQKVIVNIYNIGYKTLQETGKWVEDGIKFNSLTLRIPVKKQNGFKCILNCMNELVKLRSGFEKCSIHYLRKKGKTFRGVVVYIKFTNEETLNEAIELIGTYDLRYQVADADTPANVEPRGLTASKTSIEMDGGLQI